MKPRNYEGYVIRPTLQFILPERPREVFLNPAALKMPENSQEDTSHEVLFFTKSGDHQR